MTAMATAQGELFRPARRFFRTPKGLLLVVFAGLAALALAEVSSWDAARTLVTATLAAALTDLVVVRLSQERLSFPSGAILSGMIVGFLLSPQESWIVPIATAVLAITTKHLMRTRLANVFNPAALALVIAAVVFNAGESWWGALPDLGWPGVAVLGAAGWFIADRVNKMPLVLAFMGTYFVLFTGASVFGDSATVSEIFRAPDLHMALFFAFFMLDDPPTCPVKYRDQVQFGVIVAAAGFAFFELFGWLYFLPAALLVGNATEAWRRSRPRPRPKAKSAAGKAPAVLTRANRKA